MLEKIKETTVVYVLSAIILTGITYSVKTSYQLNISNLENIRVQENNSKKIEILTEKVILILQKSSLLDEKEIKDLVSSIEDINNINRNNSLTVVGTKIEQEIGGNTSGSLRKK